MSDLNIYQRINAVMKAVKYVQKDKQVSGGGQNYKAVTHDQLLSVIRAELVKNGIVVVPHQVEGRLLIQRDVEKLVKMHLYQGVYDIALVNVDKPDDKLVSRIHSHAADNGDKAPGKAITYATKSVLLKVFSLETGENDESRAYDPLAEAIAENAADIKIINEGLIADPDQPDGYHDLESAAAAWFEMDQETQRALWKAPSRGGPFDTKTRALMKEPFFKEAFYGEQSGEGKA